MDITDQKIKLGRKVRDLRLARELSQVELGLMIGSGKSQIWAIENARTNVKLETLCKLAEALAVDVRDLVEF
ncbi:MULTISPECIES: helix-turn-helix domain-containing protein [Gordonibacter]|uniref:helix-turn-helix domain-containing protein n=1 Tax=Gordonibacter TaxID=644652 RepID=UPI001D7FE8CA|nr:MULTISPECIES: helix-turn-helix transcriptional regulator [Gordonibacter]MDN4510236.1 helix-turn-helix domain-containing protein [Gordonibacter sp. RACS_AR49]HJF62954.1 helix-turn-helix domain-containing protein [Gordonibacter urolithinfaciens]